MTGIFRLHDSIRVTPSIPIPAETSIPAGKSVFQRKLLIISFISFLRRGSPVMQKQPHAIAFQLQRIWNSPIEFGIRYFRQFKKLKLFIRFHDFSHSSLLQSETFYQGTVPGHFKTGLSRRMGNNYFGRFFSGRFF